MIRGSLTVALFSIYPILVIVNANIDEVILTEIALPLISSLLFSISLFFIAFKVTKNQNKSALFVIFTIFFFFFYGHVFHGYFSGKHLGEITIGRHRFFFPLWCFAYLISCLVLVRIRNL